MDAVAAVGWEVLLVGPGEARGGRGLVAMGAGWGFGIGTRLVMSHSLLRPAYNSGMLSCGGQEGKVA